MKIPSPRFRFAPSPNGRLHLGHAYSALLNDAFARRMNGTFVLRMEDIDITRCTATLRDACFKDLTWLGLSWETPVRIQSQHFPVYTDALNTLRKAGLVYPCFCSRSDISRATSHYAAEDRPRDPDNATLYPGTCRHTNADMRIAKGELHAWRLDMKAALLASPGPHYYTRFDADGTEHKILADPARWGDAILARKDTPTSYHLSVVVDDAIQNISHVVRGKDLEAATDLHVLLQSLLHLPTPLYHHHELLIDDAGGKLSKSKHSETLADLKAQGKSPEDIRNMLLGQ